MQKRASAGRLEKILLKTRGLEKTLGKKDSLFDFLVFGLLIAAVLYFFATPFIS